MWSATGGGHRASAEAIRAGLHQLYGDRYDIDSVDMWQDHMEWPANQMSKSYNFVVQHSFLWKCIFNAPEEIHQANIDLNAHVSGNKLRKAFEDMQPDLVSPDSCRSCMLLRCCCVPPFPSLLGVFLIHLWILLAPQIVSLHPAMQHVPLKVLAEGQNKRKLVKRPPFATVVTDLSEGCHHLWFHKDVDRCFVPIEDVKEKAIRRGLKEEQISVLGLPVRPAFSGPLPSKPELRAKLGLDPDAKVALLVGGGEGMGPVEKTVWTPTDTSLYRPLLCVGPHMLGSSGCSAQIRQHPENPERSA